MSVHHATEKLFSPMTGTQALPSSDATKSRIILITPFGMVRTSALVRQTKVFSCWEHDLFDPNVKGSVPDGMFRIAVTPTPNLDPAILANLPPPKMCVSMGAHAVSGVGVAWARHACGGGRGVRC